MPLYGYARVSTLDQDLSIQRAALKAAGCEVIRAEKASGARRDGRTELQVLLDFLRAGDTLVVTRIDRLARSLKGPAGHRVRAEGQGCRAEGNRAAGRHRHGGRQGVPRHARRVRR
ncbi:MAG: recombinase family protein, partial [Steroidobacteraceae bacterium]